MNAPSSSYLTNHCSYGSIQLQKYGWQAGQGLGASREGRVKNISCYYKKSSGGLGKGRVESSNKWTGSTCGNDGPTERKGCVEMNGWWDDAFESGLANININVGKGIKKKRRKDKKKGETKSDNGKPKDKKRENKSKIHGLLENEVVSSSDSNDSIQVESKRHQTLDNTFSSMLYNVKNPLYLTFIPSKNKLQL